MAQAYSNPEREDDTYALPDVEIFEAAVLECVSCDSIYADLEGRTCEQCDAPLLPQVPCRDAWWWWVCFPGCLPDSDVHGPFDSEKEALADAQDIDE